MGEKSRNVTTSVHKDCSNQIFIQKKAARLDKSGLIALLLKLMLSAYLNAVKLKTKKINKRMLSDNVYFFYLKKLSYPTKNDDKKGQVE